MVKKSNCKHDGNENKYWNDSSGLTYAERVVFQLKILE